MRSRTPGSQTRFLQCGPGAMSAPRKRRIAPSARQRARSSSIRRSPNHSFSMALYKHWLTEDWFEAEPYFEKAIALHPRSSVAIVQHANFLAARQRFEESIRGTEKAIAIDPLSPIVYGIGAVSMYACRRYDRSVELAGQALEMYPGFAIALYALGLASCQIGDHDGGVEACSGSLKLRIADPCRSAYWDTPMRPRAGPVKRSYCSTSWRSEALANT